MKKIVGLLLFISYASIAQVSDTIEISAFYDVTILFEKKITTEPSIGSAGVLKNQIDANTLMLKANGKMMKENKQRVLPNTNLTVHTEEGIFIFLLQYKDVPGRNFITPSSYEPIYRIRSATETASKPIDSEQFKADNFFEKLSYAEPEFSGIGILDRKFKMKMEVTNIWVDSTSIYFKVVMNNFTNIPYDINYFRYFTTYGRYSFKQQTEPLDEKKISDQLLVNPNQTIESDQQFTNVIKMNKFTLNKKEFFNIQVGEINGARQITVSVSREDLLAAIPVPFY